jgi:hypothetical protein
MGKARSITIDNDVHGIAKRLYELDPSLRLQATEEDGEILWLVIQLSDEHGNPQDNGPKENFVTSMKGELDQRLLKRMEKVAGRGYDLVKEMEKAEREADAENERQRMEVMGPAAEKLMHALRKDFDVKNKVSLHQRRKRG